MLKKGDVFLGVILLLIISAGYIGLQIYKNGGNERIAVIRKDNKIIRKIDLKKLKQTEIIKVDGEYIDEIEVEPGRIRFKDANCPDRSCVSMGWISRRGDTAVCLPNRTIIEIEGESEKTDGVAY